MKKNITMVLLFVGTAYGASPDGRATHEQRSSSRVRPPNFLNAIPGKQSSEQRRQALLKAHKSKQENKDLRPYSSGSTSRATIFDSPSQRKGLSHLNAIPSNKSRNKLPLRSEPTHQSLAEIREQHGISFRNNRQQVARSLHSFHGEDPNVGATHNLRGVKEAPAAPPRRSKKSEIQKSESLPDYLEPDVVKQNPLYRRDHHEMYGDPSKLGDDVYGSLQNRNHQTYGDPLESESDDDLYGSLQNRNHQTYGDPLESESDDDLYGSLQNKNHQIYGDPSESDDGMYDNLRYNNDTRSGDENNLEAIVTQFGNAAIKDGNELFEGFESVI